MDVVVAYDGGGGGGGSGGGVKYGFTSPPGPRGFSFGLYLRIRIPLSACDVIRGTTNTIMSRVKGVVGGTRGGEGVMARLLDGTRREIQGGVLLVFSLHRHTRRQCFVSVRGKRWRRLGAHRESERNKGEDRKREILGLSAKPGDGGLSCALKRFRQFGSCDTSSRINRCCKVELAFLSFSFFFLSNASISACRSGYP